MTGPANEPASADCRIFCLDPDTDVDLADYAMLETMLVH
jgi:hypothetical protein